MSNASDPSFRGAVGCGAERRDAPPALTRSAVLSFAASSGTHRLLCVTVAALAIAAVMLVPSIAEGAPARAFIHPGGYYGSYLEKPRKFEWLTGGGYGKATKVRWRRWASRRAIARGRTKVCSNRQGVGCLRNRRVKIIASRRRAFLGPMGETQYVYCRVVLHGKIGPGAPDERISLVMATPPAVACNE